MYANVPNPFNPTTRIAFDLPEACNVDLSVHDAAGRHIVTVLDGPRTAGHHEATWLGCNSAGKSVAAGVYFYTLTTRDGSLTGRMTPVK